MLEIWTILKVYQNKLHLYIFTLFFVDYDGYDDVYGHSIDDDYYISPSNRQFIFNRENSRDQPKIGEFIRTEQDIQEEDETELVFKSISFYI